MGMWKGIVGEFEQTQTPKFCQYIKNYIDT